MLKQCRGPLQWLWQGWQMHQWILLHYLNQQAVPQLRWRTRRQQLPPLNLLVLAIGHCKASFECILSLLYRKSVISTVAINVEYSSCKDLGVRSFDLLCLTDGDYSCFCVINAILNLLE
jgi:hypothetical protein